MQLVSILVAQKQQQRTSRMFDVKSFEDIIQEDCNTIRSYQVLEKWIEALRHSTDLCLKELIGGGVTLIISVWYNYVRN